MSALSKEIARWVSTSPGMLTGPDAENVWLQAKMKFITDRRWRGPEFDMATFMQHLYSIGYRVEHRVAHSDGATTDYAMLALPQRHKGF